MRECQLRVTRAILTVRRSFVARTALPSDVSQVLGTSGGSLVFMEFLYFRCLIHIVFICDLPALLLERAASRVGFLNLSGY